MDNFMYKVQEGRETGVCEELHQKLWLGEELRMGSPWLDMILFLAGKGAPWISGGKYTGRYFPTSLYCLILYLVLQPDKIFDEVLSTHEKANKNKLAMSKIGMTEWRECMHYELERSNEYIYLRDHFMENGMGTLDINEPYHRNIEFVTNNSILNGSASTEAIREFLMSGQHTLVDLYNELVSNIIYRGDLRIVDGSYNNPDLYLNIDLPVEHNSLKHINDVIKAIDKRLKEVVVGQDGAIEKLEKSYFHNEKGAVRSAYLFAGPSGVGKTLTAKTFADAVGISCRRFDMSGYASAAALDELTGISSFYRASKQGVLTGYVNLHPHSILIFDEIEKSSPEVIRMFLQILEEGTCFDRYYDRDVSFKDCVIIMTTNAGRQLYEDSRYTNLSKLPEKLVIDALEKDINPMTKEPYFPKEIVSRLSSHTIIMFDRMSADVIRQIINNDVKRQVKDTMENCGIDISEGIGIVTDIVLYSLGAGRDARNASKLAGKLIDNELYEIMQDKKLKISELKSVSWTADLSQMDDEIKAIFLDEAGADYLCRRHLALKYKTDKSFSPDGAKAQIKFHSFSLEVAVEAEDRETIVADEIRPDKTWDDIYVSDEVRKELEYFISYLSNPKNYANTNVRAPRGALMYGPAGTGKTSLAKVVATESRLNFISVSGDEMRSKGAEMVHEVFRMARKYSPTVLFIDEIDAVGVSRLLTGSNAVLNALLTEMDGFKDNGETTVFVMAATNLIGIDHALARRFDRTFLIDLPDEKGRKWFIDHMLTKYKDYFEVSDQEVESLVSRSVNMSLSNLENFIESAVSEAIRKNIKLGDDLFDSIFEMSNHGETKEHDSLEDVEHTAYHEAGHAIVELVNGHVPEFISAVARSGFGGYVKAERLKEHPTKQSLLNHICTSMGGRAAEMEFGYGITPSASGDLKNATQLAKTMVCECGMYQDEMGLAVFDSEECEKDENVRKLINQILADELERARRIVRENTKEVNLIVEALLNSPQKSLTKSQLEKICDLSIGKEREKVYDKNML